MTKRSSKTAVPAAAKSGRAPTATEKLSTNSNAIPAAVLRDDVLASLDTMKGNLAHNTKLNQRIAWRIMAWQDAQPKAFTFAKLRADAKLASDWRANVRKFFIGTAPSMKGDKDEGMFSASKAYKARGRIVDDAANFCIIAGARGLTADHFSETLNCFAAPGAVLLGHGCTPMFTLATMIADNTMVALDNTAYMVMTKNKDGKEAIRDIRASLAQVLSVGNEKTKPAPKSAEEAKAADAISGRSEIGTIAEPVIRSVLKNAGIEKLALALRVALNADPNLVIRRTDFNDDVWMALTSIAQRVNSIAQTAAMLDEGKANKAAAA